MASDYRTWGNSDIGHSFFYSGLVIDVINLIQAIPSIPEADPLRVGILGHSMGGGVTMSLSKPRVEKRIFGRIRSKSQRRNAGTLKMNIIQPEVPLILSVAVM